MLPFFTLLTSTSFLKLIDHYRSRKQAHLPNLNLISKLVSDRQNLRRNSLNHGRRELPETVLPNSQGPASLVNTELVDVLRLPSDPFSSPPLLAARFESLHLRQSVLPLLSILTKAIATSQKLGVRAITEGLNRLSLSFDFLVDYRKDGESIVLVTTRLFLLHLRSSRRAFDMRGFFSSTKHRSFSPERTSARGTNFSRSRFLLFPPLPISQWIHLKAGRSVNPVVSRSPRLRCVKAPSVSILRLQLTDLSVDPLAGARKT